nr:hypothetical protein [uncultured Flavobacterium sp.]
MKKYACLLLFAIMLNGCDDGDLVPEIIEFDEEKNPESCDTETNELIYKLKPQEALILQLGENTFSDVLGEKEISISDTGLPQLVYRTFDGVINRSNICDAIRPSAPNVSSESKAVGGKIKITTTANESDPAPDGSTKINGFKHSIYMSDISYSIPGGGEQVNPNFYFGVLTTSTYNSPLVSFTATNAKPCNQTQVFNYTGNTSMIIDALDPLLIQNIETSEPRKSTITATQNQIVFNTYKTASITAAYFCQTPRPTAPEIDETWNAAANGEIEVVTTKSGTQYTHIITLKNVELSNTGGLKFKLPSSFIFGEITTQ